MARWAWTVLALGLCACAVRGGAAPALPTPSLPTAVVVISTSTPAPASLPTTPAPRPAATLALTPTPVPTLAPPTATPEPLPTPDAQAQSRQVVVPILMYHYVEPWPADADEIRKNLTVRPDDFAAQMDYLHAQGYTTVSLYDLVYALTLGRPLPPKAVIVTFDDGYHSLPQYAVPTMERYGYRGTIFVITEFMDNGLAAYLTWPEAESLYQRGWKIEPHSKSHQELAGRDRAFQVYQMLGSIQTVAAHIGVQPRFFCYPSGKYDDLTLQLARELNLWGAVTVEFGRTHTLKDLYTLKRVRVGGQEALAGFEAGLQPSP